VGYSSGQRGQTVNLLAYAYEGSNPSPTTTFRSHNRIDKNLLFAPRNVLNAAPVNRSGERSQKEAANFDVPFHKFHWCCVFAVRV
jgi:hypothetical protein